MVHNDPDIKQRIEVLPDEAEIEIAKKSSTEPCGDDELKISTPFLLLAEDTFEVASMKKKLRK